MKKVNLFAILSAVILLLTPVNQAFAAITEDFTQIGSEAAHPARIIYVDDDLTDYPKVDFTSIQDAVNAASGVDTIREGVISSKPNQLSAEPELEWSKAFGGSGWDCGYSVQQTSGGGYIIAGEADSYEAGNRDVWLIKLRPEAPIDTTSEAPVIEIANLSCQELSDLGSAVNKVLNEERKLGKSRKVALARTQELAGEAKDVGSLFKGPVGFFRKFLSSIGWIEVEPPENAVTLSIECEATILAMGQVAGQWLKGFGPVGELGAAIVKILTPLAEWRGKELATKGALGDIGYFRVTKPGVGTMDVIYDKQAKEAWVNIHLEDLKEEWKQEYGWENEHIYMFIPCDQEPPKLRKTNGRFDYREVFKGEAIQPLPPVSSKQPQLKAPWRGIAEISQGNHGSYSHYDHGTWDNTYAIDVALPVGTDVLAPADGVVVMVYPGPDGLGGKQLAIEHAGPTGKKFITVYLHLSEVTVVKGAMVKQGDVVAKSGQSGDATAPHLHFHIWSGMGTYDSHTAPIERLIIKQVGTDSGFREYDAGKGDLDDEKVARNSFESNNSPESHKRDKTFGGTSDDCGVSVQQTSDGGYIIAGLTASYGAGYYDAWLIKTDSNGDKTWDKTFGGTYYDCGTSVQQTSDRGYIIVGRTGYSYGVVCGDAWLIKTDSNGDKTWDKTFGGTGNDNGISVQQTSDGGYIIAGETDSYGAGNYDAWLIKTDSDGDKTWDKTFGGTGYDAGFSVQQTSDGGYIMVGTTKSYGAGDYDVWLIKTDSDGDKTWDKTFGGTYYDCGLRIQQTSDGGYIIAGMTKSYGAGNYDAWLIKTDSDGNKTWDKTFGGTGDDNGCSVQQTSDGGYIMVGETDSYRAGDYDAWLIKTDSDGDKTWDKTFGGTGDDIGKSVQQTSDGGYIIVGYTGSYGAGERDVWLIKTDSNGDK